MIVVPMTNTPIAFKAIPGIVKEAITKELGSEPDSTTINNLSALIALEVGRGKSLHNHNLGNISVAESFTGKAWRPPWFEITDSSSALNKFRHSEMLKGRAPRAFRAYDSITEGAGDWARRMRTTFRDALDAAGGSTEAFRLALSKGYSHEYADPKSGVTLAALVKEFGGDPGTNLLPTTGRGVGAGLLLAGLGLSWYALRHVGKRRANNQGSG